MRRLSQCLAAVAVLCVSPRMSDGQGWSPLPSQNHHATATRDVRTDGWQSYQSVPNQSRPQSASTVELASTSWHADPNDYLQLSHPTAYASQSQLSNQDWCNVDACPQPCVPAFAEHRTGLFGSFLYLSPRNTDLAYATPVDGLIPTAVPLGSSAIVDPDYDPGFRVGGVYALDPSSSITATYSYYRNTIGNSLAVPGGNGFIRSEVTHPSTLDVAADSLSARATSDIDFQTVDLAYQAILVGGDNYVLNYLVGVRYARLEQQFRSEFSIGGTTTVDTNIDFDGIGPRFGLEGKRLFQHGFLVYGQGFANLLMGQSTADYAQQNVLVGRQATAGFDDDRFAPQIEWELGVGWQNACGTLRLSAGYYVAVWFNAVTTPTWIDAVQANNFTNVNESLVFDGMILQAEYRF